MMKSTLEITLKTKVLYPNLLNYLEYNFDSFDSTIWKLCRMHFDMYCNEKRSEIISTIEEGKLPEYITNRWKEQVVRDYSLGHNLLSIFTQLWGRQNDSLSELLNEKPSRSLAIKTLVENKEIITNFIKDLLNTCVDHEEFKSIELQVIISFLAQLQNASTENELMNTKAVV